MSTEKANAYSAGYAAASKRVKRLEREIESLRARKPAPGQEETVEYLITVAETMTKAAALIIGFTRSEHTTLHT